MSDIRQPLNPDALRLEAASGGLASYPPVEKWDDWVEYDTAQWPRKVEKHCRIIPTICFNCEAACGLLRFCRKGHQSHSPLRRQSRTSRQPRPQLRQRAGDAQSSNRSRTDSLSAEASRQARRRQMGTRDLGRSSRRHRRRACAKRFKKNGATRSCITSAGPAMSCSIISGFFIPGASTATTATPTSVPPARAPVTRFGRASTGRRRIMPTRASFCCSARISKPATTSIRMRSASSKAKNARHQDLRDRYAAFQHRVESGLLDFVLAGQRRRRFCLPCAISFCRKIYSIASSCASGSTGKSICAKSTPTSRRRFKLSSRVLKDLYAQYTPEFAAKEAGIDPKVIVEVAHEIAKAGSAFSSHVWRNTAAGNLGGWQVARALQFLVVLVGAVGTVGGTAPNAANKFIPAPPLMPPPAKVWNELLIPPEYPLAFFEMSFLLPHFHQRRARQAGDVFHPGLQPGVDQSRRHELDRNAFR